VPEGSEIAGFSGQPVVLLRHTGGGKPDHYDWMIQEGSEPESPLQTWRVMVRLDELKPGDWFIAEPVVDHRAGYLTYEGPVSGGRGEVQRVARGVALVRGTEIEMNWNGRAKQRLVGTKVDDQSWRFAVRE